MASLAEWVEGSRPRTFPAAISPVLAASGVAWFERSFQPVLAFLALVVALSVQVGANFANDYSDGVKGTDAVRVGPLRLVGSGVANPGTVKMVAFASFAVAGLAGLGICQITGKWWLIFVGIACFVAAWCYTGGKHPYGYCGLGEVFVFVFFGLVAVAGTAYIQVGAVSPAAWGVAVAIGALACTILIANNLRDLENDRRAGKKTLATKLGDRGTRLFFGGTVLVATGGVLAVAATSSWWALLGWLMLIAFVNPMREVKKGAKGWDLIPVLKQTGVAQIICALGMAIGLAIPL